MKEENDIEQLFRSSFEDFEVTPPAEVKSAIDKKLNGRRFFGAWFFAVLFLLCSAVTFALYIAGNRPETIREIALAQAGETSRGDGAGNPEASSASSSSQTSTGTGIASGSSTENTANETHTSASGKDGQANKLSKTKTKAKATGKGKTAKTKTGPQTKTGKAKTLSAKGKKSTKGRSAASKKKPGGKKKPGAKKAKGSRVGGTNGENPTDGVSTGGNPADGTNGGQPDPGIPKEPSASVPKSSDSLKTPPGDTVPAAKDSVAESEPAVFPKTPGASDPKWMVSAFGGPNFGINTSKGTAAKPYSERGSYLLSLEIQRYFGDYAASSGISYAKRGDLFQSTAATTSSYASLDSIPVFNQGGDTILYYDTMTTYHTETSTTVENRLESVTTIGIPLYVGRRFAFGSSGFGMLVNAGAVFNFNTIKYHSPDLDENVLTKNKFGVNAVLRVHGTYGWKKLVFSAGVTGGWDFKPALILTGTERKRYYFTPQVGIHWQF